MLTITPDPRRHKLLILLVIILTPVTLSLAVALYFLLREPEPVDAVPLAISAPVLEQLTQVKPEKLVSPLPVRLKIPGINVDAPLDYVGLTPDGAMGAPKGRISAAWFEPGPRPGEIGSAVIDGHFGWTNGLAAVFDDLYKLRQGDKIYVEDEKGVAVAFAVTELRIYDQHQDATDVFSSTDGKAHLNLITCEGVWNKAKQVYASRLVVFSEKIEE